MARNNGGGFAGTFSQDVALAAFGGITGITVTVSEVDATHGKVQFTIQNTNNHAMFINMWVRFMKMQTGEGSTNVSEITKL